MRLPTWGGGPPMSSCAARPSAESVVSARGRGCRQDAVEAPAGGGSALEHPKLANAEGRVEGGWASRRGPDVFRQELCASTVRKPTAVCAVGAVGEISRCGEAPQLVHPKRAAVLSRGQ